MTSTLIDPEKSEVNPRPFLHLCRQTVPVIDNARPREIRQRGEEIVERLEFPRKKDEEWQFTDLSPLLSVNFQNAERGTIGPEVLNAFLLPEARRSRLVFLNGFHAPEWSDLSALSAGITVGNLFNAQNETIVKYLGEQKSEDFFSGLNSAGLSDVAVIHLSRGTIEPLPVHLLFLTLAGDTPRFSQPRILIVAEAGARVSVVENHAAIAIDPGRPYFTNSVAEIYLEAGAEVRHTRLQRESRDAFHIGRTAIEQGRDSRYTLDEIVFGAKLYRHDPHVTQSGEGTETILNGLTTIGGEQTADTHGAVYLNRPGGTVKQLHKCIVDGDAHAIFNGKVLVPKPAGLTDASQLNRNLLLSPRARVNTKPELQITADNVKCSHGATVSQLEADEIFYLQSRGLTAQEARNLLIDAFSAEILDKLPLESLRQRLKLCVACRTGD